MNVVRAQISTACKILLTTVTLVLPLIAPLSSLASPLIGKDSEEYQLTSQRQLRNSSVVYERYEVTAKNEKTLSVAHVVKVPLNPSEIDVTLAPAALHLQNSVGL